MKWLRCVVLAAMFGAVISLNGCGFLIGAGAGGMAGYELKDEGYEVQSPVKKEEKRKEN